MVKRTNTQQNLTKVLGRVLGTVLAGGKSSRMGSDKAWLRFRGRTLLGCQFEKLVSVLGNENVIVSGNYPQFRSILDREPELGPLGGIISVVQEFPMAEYFLFLPVDMPNLTEKTLRHLIESALEAGKEGPQSLFNYWSYENFEMPLLIKNHKNLKAVLTEFIRQPKRLRSIRGLRHLMNHQKLEIREAQGSEFLNANTAEEWEGLAL